MAQVLFGDVVLEKRYRIFVGLLPAIHFAITDGYDKLFDELAMARMFTMCFCYLLGTVFYAFKVPERWWPGKFDIWVKSFTVLLTKALFLQFQSHQLFHVMVVLAAFVHYQGITDLAQYRTAQGGCDVLPTSTANDIVNRLSPVYSQ